MVAAIKRTANNVHMLKVVEPLTACYDILYAGPCFLDAASLNELRAQLSRLGRHYQWLLVYAMDKGQTNGT